MDDVEVDALETKSAHAKRERNKETWKKRVRGRLKRGFIENRPYKRWAGRKETFLHYILDLDYL